MIEFQNLSYKCIKGMPIADVVCRTLTEVGFPVDAPAQPAKFNQYLDNCFWKLSDTNYAVVGTVESEYIKRLLNSGSQEQSFHEVLELLSPYEITREELRAQLISGCVLDLTPADAQMMLDEFVFIIQRMLPRQLSDIYYSFDIKPNPAHGVFFDIAAERLAIPKQTDRRKDNYGQFISHTRDGAKLRIANGESFLSIYQNTCATKEIVKNAYSDFLNDPHCISTKKLPSRHIEMVLFGLARKYEYRIYDNPFGMDDTFAFVVYEDGQPGLAIDYCGEKYFDEYGRNFIEGYSYDKILGEVKEKHLACCSAAIPYLMFDFNELESGTYVGSIIRDALKNPATAELHQQGRADYFLYERALEDCNGNEDAIEDATVAGCFECCSVIDPKTITETDEEWSAICPVCGGSSVIFDSQGYTITKEYLTELHRRVVCD